MATEVARAEPLPRAPFDALEPRVRHYLQPIVDRVGYFGEFFAVLGPLPDALLAFMEYTKAVKAPLSERHNEVLALTVCGRLGAVYERVQHERLSERLGFARDWIATLSQGAAPAATLDAEEALLVELAEATLADPASPRAREALARARALLGDTAALAAVLQIARFQMIATLVHAFELRLPVRSTIDGR